MRQIMKPLYNALGWADALIDSTVSPKIEALIKELEQHFDVSPPEPVREFYTLADVAKRYHVSVERVIKWCNTKDSFPEGKLNDSGVMVWAADDLNEWEKQLPRSNGTLSQAQLLDVVVSSLKDSALMVVEYQRIHESFQQSSPEMKFIVSKALRHGEGL